MASSVALGREDVICYHCGEKARPGSVIRADIGSQERHFCCNGCLSACLIIHEAGEESYYDNRTAFPSRIFSYAEVPDIAQKRDQTLRNAYDLQSVMEEYTSLRPHPSGEGELRHIHMSIEGIHCSSCVFLNERILSKTRGVYEASVNYESGRASILFDPDVLKISEIIRIIQSIGYNAVPLMPGQKSEILRSEGRVLLWKMVLSGFLTANLMMIAVALWAGFFDGSLAQEFKDFFHWFQFALATPIYLYAANTYHRGWKSFLRTGIPGMDFLVSSGLSVAYFYSVYVTLTGVGEVYFDSVGAITFLLLIGRFLEWRARLAQRVRMESLIQPLPVHCHRMIDEEQSEIISVNDLERGDMVAVETGGTVPSDGVVLRGSCEIDESVLTGESMPVVRQAGDRVLAGSRLVSGRIRYRVDSLPHESSLSMLAKLAESAEHAQSSLEKLTIRTTPYFSVVVLFIAAGSFVTWFYLLGAPLEKAMVTAIAVLIVSCPCALALAVPTAVGSAIYLGLRNGILIRDGVVLEMLNRVEHLFLDKTGTITRGQPALVGSALFAEQSEVESLVWQLESGSAHPMARAMLEWVRESVDIEQLEDLSAKRGVGATLPEEVPGKGMFWQRSDGELRLGSLDYIREGGLELSSEALVFIESQSEATLIALRRNQTLLALFALSDTAEEITPEAIAWLRNSGYQLSILTGDRRETALRLAGEIDLPDESVHASLLPEDKERIVREYSAKGVCVGMVGDGYNDAIALSAADVSVVMARGAPLSLEHGGVILLQNNLGGLIHSLFLARRASRTIKLNLTFSLCYNSIMIPLAAFGYMLPIWCALFMALSSLTVIGSSAVFRLRGIPEWRESGRA